jgi:glycosyltransferase involved in cell wall biosynthesis
MRTDTPAPEGSARGPVAVVVFRVPATTETFILRELIEMERLGVELVLVSLLRHRESVVHPQARPWIARALYTPFLNGAILLENLRVLMRAPRLYLSTLAGMFWEARRSANALFGLLGIFPKSVWLARRLRTMGVRHVHAHFATHPAAAAYVIARVSRGIGPPLSYSVTVHAHDIFIHQAGLARKLSGASFVRSISDFNVRFLQDRLGPAGPESARFRVIHCGIDPADYRHGESHRGPGTERPVRILSIASLRPYKGITHLIEAVRKLRADEIDVECEVIGEGELRRELEDQIDRAELRGRFRLPGGRTEEQVAQALSTADLFVLPSVVAPDGQMEGIPVALMEALASGVPAISTRISGIPELVVDGQTGRLVEPADPAGLAAAIREAVASPERSREMAEAGRRRVVEEFSLDRNVRLLVSEIEAECGARGGTPADGE